MKNKVYFITGGGTGGHIYPAIAVADELLEQDNTNKIYYVGNPKNLEAEIVKCKNYIFLPVNSFGMPRKVCLKLLLWIWQMFLGWIKCCFYILKYKPDIVFGTGGYVSAPILFAAITMKIPFVMHDCDANPGLVTRKLAPFAKSLSVAFDVGNKLNNKYINVNGNPIRKEFITLTKSQARKNLGLDDRLTICVMGGSQGAKSINTATVNILQVLSQELGVQVIFQTGKKNFNNVITELKNIYPNYNQDKNLIIRPYFDNMVEVLKSSDIAISRAGSLSISEICACGIVPIFIPYPYAAADHQRKNAKYMVEKDAGLYLEDADTNSESLLETLKQIINDKDKLKSISDATSSMAIYDAAKRIVNQLN